MKFETEKWTWIPWVAYPEKPKVETWSGQPWIEVEAVMPSETHPQEQPASKP